MLLLMDDLCIALIEQLHAANQKALSSWGLGNPRTRPGRWLLKRLGLGWLCLRAGGKRLSAQAAGVAPMVPLEQRVVRALLCGLLSLRLWRRRLMVVARRRFGHAGAGARLRQVRSPLSPFKAQRCQRVNVSARCLQQRIFLNARA